MLQGICIDSGYTDVLKKGTRYYLVQNGASHYYVSKFPTPGSHKGCFQAKYFQVIEKDVWPKEPEARLVNLDPEKVYKAKLIWRKPGYKSIALKDYYVQPKETNGTFYHDSKLQRLGGCFPLQWFVDFVEIEIDETVPEIADFDIKFEETEQFSYESEPKIANYEQLSLFDF